MISVTNKPFMFNFSERIEDDNLKKMTIDPKVLINKLNLGKLLNDRDDPPVLILTKKTDIESDLLGIKLLKNDLDYVKINEEDIPLKFQFRYYIGETIKSQLFHYKRKISPEKVKLVLFRHFDLRFLSYCSGLRQMYFSQQWNQAFHSLKMNLNCMWINDLEKTFTAENRYLQLITAKKTGFKIPETLITNFPPAGKEFFDKCHKSMVAKVLHHHEINLKCVSYRFLTNEVKNSHLSSYNDLIYAPVIFQKKIKNRVEIRTTVIKNKVYSCEIGTRLSKDKFLDLHKFKEADLKFKEITMDRKTRDLCLHLNKKLGLSMSSIDFVIDNAGNLIFLEVNPVGDWFWIEKRTNLPITEAVFDLINSHLIKKHK